MFRFIVNFILSFCKRRYFLEVPDNEQVLLRSLVRPMNDKEVKKSCSNNDEVLNLVVGEIEGSKTSETENINLNFLSEIVNSPIPEVDIIQVNSFDAREHIGMEYIKKNKGGVPTIVKMIEVDEDTGRWILEYIYGGLEVIEPRVIQEALLSKEQEDDGGNHWTFEKFLNHRIVKYRKVEFELL